MKIDLSKVKIVSIFVERLDAQLLTWQLVAQSSGQTFNVNIPA